jgi:hypothetical protein
MLPLNSTPGVLGLEGVLGNRRALWNVYAIDAKGSLYQCLDKPRDG